MADYYSPWGDAADGFDRVGQSVGNVLVNLARNRAGMAQAQFDYNIKNQQLQLDREMNKERGALFKAQAALQQAEMLKTQKEQEQLQTGLDLSQQFGLDMEGLMRAQQGQVPLDENAMRTRAVGTAAKLAAMGKQHLPVNMAQLGAMDDPRMRTLMATDTRVPTEIGVNQVPLDVVNGALQKSGILATPPGYTITDRATGQQQQTTPLPHSNLGGISAIATATMKRAGEIAEAVRAFQAANPGQPIPPELEQENRLWSEAAAQQRDYGVRAVQNERLQPQGGVKQGMPDKNQARQEALMLIQKHPDKTGAIKKRYFETFNEELR